MRVFHLVCALALLVLPAIGSAQPAPPQPPAAPAPAAQPGMTVAPAQPPAQPVPPAQPAPPRNNDDRRIILSTQPGGTAEPEATLHYKGPKFAWEGAEFDLSIPGWYPEIGLPLLSATWGLWAGGRGSVFVMPLGQRLRPLTDAHGLDAFEGEIFTIGPRVMFEVDRTLRLSLYFDTGSQDVEQKFNGHTRQAHVNLTRLGIGLEALQPIDHLIKLTPAMNTPPPFLFIKPGDIRIGIGLEMGGGNLNLSYRGHDPDKDWTHNEPLMYMTPMGIVSVPLNPWSSLDFYAGYQFVRMNEFALRYIGNRTDKIHGNDFDGWVSGIQLLFGSNVLNELHRKNQDGGG